MVVVRVLPDVGGEGLVDRSNKTPDPKTDITREKEKREAIERERERESHNKCVHENQYQLGKQHQAHTIIDSGDASPN